MTKLSRGARKFRHSGKCQIRHVEDVSLDIVGMSVPTLGMTEVRVQTLWGMPKLSRGA